MLRKIAFPVLVALIAGVSLFDTFLIVKFADDLIWMEENPIGRWLLRVNNWQVGLFVSTKLIGTCIVVGTLITLRHLNSRKTMPVTTSVAAFQTGLLGYLTLV